MIAAERFAGVLLGTAVADTLGFVVEGAPRGYARGWADAVRALGPEALAKVGAGQYTDDTQLTRELMISVRDAGGFDPVAYAARALGLYRSGGIVGIGLATERACARMEAGEPWDRAGEPAPSAGNGTIMRAAPIGLLGLTPTDRGRAAHEQGLCTHRDPRCSAGSVAVAAATAELAVMPAGAPVDPAAFCGRVADAMRPWDDAFAALVAALPSTLTLSEDDALARIAPAGLHPEESAAVEYEWDGISPFVVPSLLWSLRSFLLHPDDYVSAVLRAIEGGGDTDSTAAVAGALAGARLGLAAVPTGFIAALHDGDRWTGVDLIRLAVECHAALGRSADRCQGPG